MTNTIILSLRKDLQINETSEGYLYLQTPAYTLSLKEFSSGIRQVVKVLASDGGSEDFLSEIVLREDWKTGLVKFYYYLQRFIQKGLICYSIPWLPPFLS